MPTDYTALPFIEQITFFRNKVNTPTATWRDVWKSGHDKGFMVAGAAKADLLEDFRQTIDKMIAQGMTIKDFRDDFDRIVKTHGWEYNGGRGWRTRVIYETNLRTSYQAGRFAQLTNPKLLKSRPFWRYHHSDSVQHPRPLHLKWHNTILHSTNRWWLTHFAPNGWGCKCKIFAESQRTLEKRYGKTKTDPTPNDGIVDGRPAGIDEGWDYAPGASVAEVTRKQVLKKARKLPKVLKDSLIDRIKNIPAVGLLPDEDIDTDTEQ